MHVYGRTLNLTLRTKERYHNLIYLLEDGYRTFYHIVFLEVSKSYGVIPNGLKIKKDACIGNTSKNFVTTWALELSKAEIQLMEDLILEHVRKLYAIEKKKLWFTVLASHGTGRLAFLNKKSFRKLEKSGTLEKTQEAP